MRIESEIKLSVPRDETEEVWRYLTKRYGGSADSLLAGIDPGFETSFSEEHFVDRYFDNDALDLLHTESGIRHRTRRVLSDPSHRKDGRQLMQLKLRRDGDLALNRSEIKFAVEEGPQGRDPYYLHPVIRLVAMEQREAFVQTVAEAGIDATALQHTLTLEQRRRRVYISRDGKPFATITLDEVSSSKWWSDLRFTEVEMELNEIGYTEASPADRARMERVNDRMKDDLLAAFPNIVQDQTPKYNKVFARFDEQFAYFPAALNLGTPLEVWFTALPALSAGVAVLLWRQRRGSVLDRPPLGRMT